MTLQERVNSDIFHGSFQTVMRCAATVLAICAVTGAVQQHLKSEREARMTIQLMAVGFPAVNARCAVETERPEDIVVCVKNSTKGLPQ